MCDLSSNGVEEKPSQHEDKRKVAVDETHEMCERKKRQLTCEQASQMGA